MEQGSRIKKQVNIGALLRNSQQKAFSTGILSLVLLNIIIWGSLRPTINTIIKTKTEYEKLQRDLITLKEQNVTLSRLISEREDLKESLKNIDSYFPNDENYSLFIDNIHRILSKFGYDLISISFTSDATSVKSIPTIENMDPIIFDLTVKGQVGKVKEVTSYLENLPFVPQIISINYSVKKVDNSKDNNVQISFRLLLYKYKIKNIKDEG